MLTTLDTDEKSSAFAYLQNVSVPELETIVDKEWNDFLLNNAWNNIKGSLTEKVRDAYVMLNRGESLQTVASQVGIKENTVYVYRLRVQEKLAKEISLLEKKLS